MKKLPERKSLRLETHDYRTCGVYFVTICSKDMRCLFGGVNLDQVILSPLGQIVHDRFEKMSEDQPMANAHAFVVMPNHAHALIELTNRDAPVATRSLSTVIGTIKYLCARQWREQTGLPGVIWHRSFHDRCVRDEREY